MSSRLTPSELDPLDLRLLVLLDQDPLATWQELAEHLSIGARTVISGFTTAS